ncbi:NPL4-like protein 1 isoform X6 [Gossypium hirsutum]|uniref:NPL4-like protein 1 isoform X6 n=1 Tax=Gossypium hirsutum TaxID=3635 RepID=A0ABM3BJ09_GOSHI|nr:NPL4-like protein 1 isoform X6 [Gossypium hirsutum]
MENILQIFFRQRQISFLFSRSWLKLGVKPDVVTFSTLIKGLCQRSKISQAGFLQNNYTSKATELLIEMGSLSSTFLIENQNNFVAMRTLKNHLDKTKSLPFVKRIADFHLLLFLAMFHGLGSDVLTLAACVSTETTVPEGYQLLIESMANTF